MQGASKFSDSTFDEGLGFGVGGQGSQIYSSDQTSTVLYVVHIIYI